MSIEQERIVMIVDTGLQMFLLVRIFLCVVVFMPVVKG